MKAIFFDFDGTLTYKSPNIWREIWKECGYSVASDSYYKKIYKEFLNKEITYQRWCDLSLVEYQKAGFTKQKLMTLASKIKLINGLSQTLIALKEEGYSIHIVSGNISSVIKKALGRNAKYFDSISANEMTFFKNGKIKQIKGTEYDFEGKAKFIENFKEKTNSKCSELIFVGNSSNDEWAYLSGCKTICINPEDTDSTNTNMWHFRKENVKTLTEILPFINKEK